MKRLSRSLAAALMLALLAGCGQAQPGTDVNGSSSSVGQPNQSVSDSSTGGQTVPVLMGGALPFTGMESVTAENYPDGTYFYQDVTQDGQTDVFNVCQPNRITDGVDEDDYLCAAARALDPESSTVYQWAMWCRTRTIPRPSPTPCTASPSPPERMRTSGTGPCLP